MARTQGAFRGHRQNELGFAGDDFFHAPSFIAEGRRVYL